MAYTLLGLDMPRTELIEGRLHYHRKAKDIASSIGGRNLTFTWPFTQTQTLQPINITPAFTQSDYYDDLKLNITDWDCDSTLWRQTFEEADQVGGYDPFMSLVVPADQVPDDYPHGGGLLLTSIQAPALPVPKANLQSTDAVQFLTSHRTFPANQGFLLRLHLDGRAGYQRGSPLSFQFGEYLLVLNSTGMAQLYQTPDFTSWAQVYEFRWADQGEVHDRHHRLLIFPHCRNQIEFLAGNVTATTANLFGPRTATVSHMGGGVYTIPGELVYDGDNDVFLITASAPCTVYATREFRPFIQVSRLAFVNGGSNDTPANAFVFDSPINMPYPPLNGFQGRADFDSNGCEAEFGLFDLQTKETWQPGNGSRQMVFAAQFHGLGDNDDGTSSRTPELYGYSLRKGPLFQDSDTTPVYVLPESTRIATGGSPEAEELTVTVPNGKGQVDAYTRRGFVPVALGDGDTRQFLFEGVLVEGEALLDIHGPPSWTPHIRGMGHMLTKAHWNQAAPNFGHDVYDEQNRGCFWSEAVYTCFEAGGVSRDEVVIEDIDVYDFRLWDEAGGGGASGGSGGSPKGDGHKVNKQAKFQPKADSTPADFLDFLLRGFLGWHWGRSVLDRRWHVWKRPIPTNSNDRAKLNKPKAIFVGDTTAARKLAANDHTIPVYVHSGYKEHAKKAQHTGVIVSAVLNESRLLSKADLQQALMQEQTGGNTAGDSAYTMQDRLVECPLINYNGYPNQLNGGNPDRSAFPLSLDWLGMQSWRDLYTTAPNREALEFVARRAFYDQCFGQLFSTLNSTWGDPVSVGFRKWDYMLIDSGRDPKTGRPNGKLEDWLVDSMEPAWKSDQMRRADYRFVKARNDCPPPY